MDESNGDTQYLGLPTVLQYLFLFITFWQFAYNISNNAFNALLRFMKFFVRCLGVAFHNDDLANTSDLIPIGLKTVYKILGCDGDMFVRYVVCPQCHSIYNYDDCVEMIANKRESKRCRHVAYPNHTRMSQRKQCGTLLLKKVRSKHGYSLQPMKVYSYHSLKSSMAQLVKKPGFLESCEKWRRRCQCMPESYYGDVYDGSIWRSFNDAEGWNFLTSPFNYLLTLNVDWFEPFERGVYAVGVVYLTLQNLPREVRYSTDMVILVGIIPGPKEPKLNINSYLTPLVQELQEAWNEGFSLVSPQNMHITVRLALSCVSCDIPASRKVCGFLGHNAALGCNKCLKKFDVPFGSRANYSGYDRASWVRRTKEDHHKRVKEVIQQKTKTAIESVESKNGVRYSVLLCLPYFDPINFTVIDTMHNLLLGTGKHMFSLWVDRDILTKKMLTELEHRISAFRVPAEVGRLPCRIGSLYGSFTAAQWRNWITIYSPVVLKGILPDNQLRCWLLFVRACCIVCSRVITVVDINSADLFLLQFCKQVEEIYGWEACTTNMHLHLHLKQCFEDFGPAHSFWCFSFERYNGILGSYHTNKRSIETQLMKKFLTAQAIHSLPTPADEAFHSILPHSISLQQTEKFFSLSNFFEDRDSIQRVLRMPQEDLRLVQSFEANNTVSPIPPFQEKVLTSEDVRHLKRFYQQFYHQRNVTNFSHYSVVFGKVLFAGDLIGSMKRGTNNSTSSIIMARWFGSGNDMFSEQSRRLRVGEVQYFLKHAVTLEGSGSTELKEHIFAYVFWKKLHPQEDWFGVSATVSTDLYELSGSGSFLPVQRIACRCAHACMNVNFPSHMENVFVVCPIPVKFCV